MVLEITKAGSGVQNLSQFVDAWILTIPFLKFGALNPLYGPLCMHLYREYSG